MIPQIFWIEEFKTVRIGTMARPRGGDWLEDEVQDLKRAGVSVVASGLTDMEMAELDIMNQPKICLEHEIKLLRYPIEDRGVPASLPEWIQFIGRLKEETEKGNTIVAHCRMGIGRASLIAVSLMVSCGINSKTAFDWVENARGCPVPDTDEQREWVQSYEDVIR